MPDIKPEVLRIFCLLTPKHRADLLAWIQLAYVAENSARKSLGFNVPADGVSSLKPQECSCEKLLHKE